MKKNLILSIGAFAVTMVLSSNMQAQTALTAPASVAKTYSTAKAANPSSPQTAVMLGKDVKVATIDAPFTRCGLGNAETVIVTLENAGTDKVGNFQVSYKLDANTTVTETYVDSLIAGEKKSFKFATKADLSAIQSYTLKSSTALTGDENPGNDEVTSNITNSTSMYLNNGSIITGFETGDDATLLNVVDANADGVTWNPANTNLEPRSGKRYAAMFVSAANTPNNDWLITNCLQLEAGATYKIEFYYHGNVTGGAITGAFEILLGRDGTPAAMDSSLFKVQNISGTAYKEFSKTFSVNETGGYFLGLKEFSSSSVAAPTGQVYYAVSIDDFKLTKIRNASIIASRLVSPATGCELDQEPVTVTLLNNGLVAQSNFDVTYKVGSGAVVSQQYTGTINPGESKDFTFSSTADLSTGTNFIVTTSTSLAVTGEELKQAITEVSPAKFTTASSKLAVGFEDADAATLVGWETLDANGDSSSWVIRFLPTSAHTDNYVLSYPSGENADEDGDDWYFTKCLSLDSTKAYKLTFWYNVVAADPEMPSFEVTIGNAQDPSAQTKLLGTYDTGSDGDYAEIILDGITIPSKGIYYIGFHNTSVANSGNVFIDDFDFRLGKAVTPPNGISTKQLESAVALYPNPSKGISKLKIDFDTKQDVTVIVTDVLGKVISSTNHKNILNSVLPIDLSNEANGVYFVKIETESSSLTKRVVLAQ